MERLVVCTGPSPLRANERASTSLILGWIILLSGTTLWLYGYFAFGSPSLIDWHSRTPWYIADFLPNLEAEIGLVLICVGMVPIYWPRKNETPAE